MAIITTDSQIHGHRLRSRPAVGYSKFAIAGLCLLLAITFSQPLQAQQKVPKKASAFFQKAYYDIGLNKFETAREYLKEAIKIYPDYDEAHLYLADLFYQTKEYDKAIAEYEWISQRPSPPSRVDHFLAKAYFAVGRFDEAAVAAERYAGQPRISERALRDATLLAANARFSKKAMQNPQPFHAVNLGKAVNTEDSEYLPSLNADESTVIFTRLLRGQEDLYATGIDKNGQWLPAEALQEGTINTGHNEGAHCISADGKLLLFTICNERNTRGSCDLYLASKTSDGWSQPRNIGPEVNSVSWDSQPTLSADGLTIYFVSNRPGGYGGKDLYVTHWEKGSWTEPANLGPEINTPYDEQTPFIHFDNQTLYFSSDGHPGLGLHDSYISRFADGRWTTPVNLGYPINTNQIESGLTVSLDGSRAYYAAEKPEGFGKLDIYEFALPAFALPKRVTYVRANIVDKATGKPIEATYTLYNLSADKDPLVGTAKDGEFLICLPSGNEYGLQVQGDGYVIESMNFNLKDTVERKAYVLNIGIDPVEKGHKMILRNVFFETDSYTLLPSSYSELDELIALLKKHSDRKVEISGHTDNTGDGTYNQKLSANRAESVVQYLINNGISADQLVAKGYGDTMPIADNSTTQGRALNRRTEVKILD